MSSVGLRPMAEGRPGGALVALAHGLEDSWESWRPLVRQLNPAWRVIALDLPWRPGNDYRWRRRASASWLADGLDGLDRRPDLVLAHSFGANALLELLCARDRRADVAAMLICPLYRPPDVAITWKVFDRARRAFERHIHDSLRSRLAGRAAQIDGEVVELMIAKAVDRIGPAGFLAVFDQFCASASLRLDQVDTDVLVLAGGSDPTLSPAAAGVLARQMPRASLIVDDSYDHFCYARKPVDVATRVTTFARSLSATATGSEGASR